MLNPDGEYVIRIERRKLSDLCFLFENVDEIVVLRRASMRTIGNMWMSLNTVPRKMLNQPGL